MACQMKIMMRRSLAVCFHDSRSVGARDTRSRVSGMMIHDKDLAAGKNISSARPRRKASFFVCSNAVIGGIKRDYCAHRVYDEAQRSSEFDHEMELCHTARGIIYDPSQRHSGLLLRAPGLRVIGALLAAGDRGMGAAQRPTR